MKNILLFSFLFVQLFVFGQNSSELNVQLESMISTGKDQPFWLTSNQNGKYSSVGNNNQLVSLSGTTLFENIFHSELNASFGTHLIANYSGQFGFQANELYSKLYWKGWKMEGGWFKEPEYFQGISSTNGNIDRSNNARPYPRIRFGTNEFIPFLFWKNWFSFKAEYDEGWLNDERVIKNTRLHHKSLFGKINWGKSSSIAIGLNHFVMWGGTSPVSGELPQSFKDYLIYITGSVGGSNFPVTDQMNVAGNQFGSYLVQYNLKMNSTALAIYINHPFEDHSGMEWRNPFDNLYGINVSFQKNKLLESFLYEFMYTKHQGGSAHVQGSTGLDDYYNHGTYNSGYSYNGLMMVSPLFSPLVFQNNKIVGTANNRIVMHHIGFTGKISQSLSWNGKFTYSCNFGTYNNPFEPMKQEISSLLCFNYHSTQLPVNLSLLLAVDAGQLYENRFGTLLKIYKTF